VTAGFFAVKAIAFLFCIALIRRLAESLPRSISASS
jgi:hypothetical protein